MRASQFLRMLPWPLIVLGVFVAITDPMNVTPETQSTQDGGCFSTRVGPGSDARSRVLLGTEDPYRDAILKNYLEVLAGWYKVSPRLLYVDDTGAPNAYFTPMIIPVRGDTPSDPNPFGTILFGKNLIYRELGRTPRDTWGNYSIIGILAHELAHALQHQRKNTSNTLVKELQADFIAGWAMRVLQRTIDPSLREGDISNSFYGLGDTLFDDPQHHGTKKERQDAFLGGFDIEANDVNTAYTRAEDFLKKHPPITPPHYR